jgi:hypothetical protein
MRGAFRHDRDRRTLRVRAYIGAYTGWPAARLAARLADPATGTLRTVALPGAIPPPTPVRPESPLLARYVLAALDAVSDS